MTATPASAGSAAPSTVVYLFADRVAPLEQPGKTGQRSWSSGQVVNARTLAVRLGMAAAFALRDAGAVTLATYSKKRLLITVRGVHAKVVGPFPPFSGIEGALSAAWARDSKAHGDGADVGFTVDGIVRRSRNPFGMLVQLAIDDAVDRGYLIRAAADRGLGGVLAHKPKTQLEPQQDRIAQLRPVCDEFITKWTAFYQDERPLYDELQRSILKNLTAREDAWDD